MSTDTFYKAYVSRDSEKYKKFSEIYKLCKSCDIDMPESVYEFFNWGHPTPFGQYETIEDFCEEFSNPEEAWSGTRIDIIKLLKEIPDATHISIEHRW